METHVPTGDRVKVEVVKVGHVRLARWTTELSFE